MRRWHHNVILFQGFSLLLVVCRRLFPGQSGDRTCLVLYKRLVICFARPFQILWSARTGIPLTFSWKKFPTTSPDSDLPLFTSYSFIFFSLSLVFANLWRNFVSTFPEEMLITFFFFFLSLVSIKNFKLLAIYPKQLRFFLGSSLQRTSAQPRGALDRFRKFGLGRLAIQWKFQFPCTDA